MKTRMNAGDKALTDLMKNMLIAAAGDNRQMKQILSSFLQRYPRRKQVITATFNRYSGNNVYK